MIQQTLDKIRAAGIVCILRGLPEDRTEAAVSALYEGGIRAVEVALNSPGALKTIEKLKIRFGQRMLVGAGTVLDEKSALEALLAGADFALSPVFSAEMIQMCHRHGRPAIPGVLTPTEIFMARQAGAQVVKLFPARTFGPAYLKDIFGPFGRIGIMPVGGVTLVNAAEFMRCGAFALGIGSELAKNEWVQEGRYDLLTQTASAFIGKVRPTKE